MFRSVITGILRVAKEDIFSGVNNLGVYGVLDDRFAKYFGFTQTEVDELLSKRNLKHRTQLVRRWYDGYRFGEDQPICLYNPWSVMSYLGLLHVVMMALSKWFDHCMVWPLQGNHNTAMLTLL